MPALLTRPLVPGHPSSRFAPWLEKGPFAASPRQWGDAPRELGRGSGNTGATTCTVTISKTGSLNGLLFARSATTNSGAANAGSGLVSVSDTRNGAWSSATIFSGSRSSTWFADLVVFYPPSIPQVGDVVTFTYGGSNDDHAVVIEEIVGADLVAPIDKSSSGGNAGVQNLTAGTTAALLQAEEFVYTAWCISDDTAVNDGGVGNSMDPTGGASRLPSFGSNDGAGNASCATFASFQYVHATTAVTQTGFMGATHSFFGNTVTIKKATGSPPIVSVLPHVAGAPQVGRSMSSDHGTWDTATSWTYQWYRADDAIGTNEVAIPTGTLATYTPTLLDEGKYVRCAVTAHNLFGDSLASYSNYIGASVMHIASDGTVTAPGVGIAGSDHYVFRQIATGRDTDHQTRTIPITDDVLAGESIMFFYGYSVNTNFTAGRTDPFGNVYNGDVVYDGTFSGLDLWTGLNVATALPVGTLLSEQAGGTPAIHPSDSIEYAIFAVTPPKGKQIVFDTSALGDTSFDTAHTTGAMTPTGVDELMIGHICMAGHNPPNWSPGTGWAEIVDQGDTTDPNISIAVQVRRVVNPGGTYASAGTSVGTTNSSQLIAGYKLAPVGQPDPPGQAVVPRHPSRAFRPWLDGARPTPGVLAHSATLNSLSLSGSITPTGGISNFTLKGLTGTLTSSGTLAKQIAKLLGGTSTPTGVVSKQAAKGAAGSIAPTGALGKQTAKAAGGSITPTGLLSKFVSKLTGGSIAPSGALATAKVFLLSLAGSITPTGLLGKLTGKQLRGAVAPGGAVGKQTAKGTSGSVTPTGTAAKTVSKFFRGAISPLGALATLITNALNTITHRFDPPSPGGQSTSDAEGDGGFDPPTPKLK